MNLKYFISNRIKKKFKIFMIKTWIKWRDSEVIKRNIKNYLWIMAWNELNINIAQQS
jgi:hypothetical protein